MIANQEWEQLRYMDEVMKNTRESLSFYPYK